MSDKSSTGSPYAFYAFYTLYQSFHKSLPEVSFTDVCHKLYPSEKVDTTSSTSLFITWKKKSRGRGGNGDNYALRGCIGTFAKLPVVTGIEKYSLIAAFQDRRFPPITASEISHLKCSCNILQNFETIYDGKGDIYDWEVGVHGIELVFKHPQTGSTCSATFLPEVIPEQGWDKKETFLNLIEKAGVYAYAKEVLDDYQNHFLKVIRYEGNKSSLSYAEFEDLMGELDEV